MKPLRPSRSLTLRLNLSRKATLKVGFFICILNPVVQGLNISHPVLISTWCVYLSHHIVFYHRKPYSEVYALSIGFFEWLQNWNRQIKWHSRDSSHILLFQKSEQAFFDGSLPHNCRIRESAINLLDNSRIYIYFFGKNSLFYSCLKEDALLLVSFYS